MFEVVSKEEFRFLDMLCVGGCLFIGYFWIVNMGKGGLGLSGRRCGKIVNLEVFFFVLGFCGW